MTTTEARPQHVEALELANRIRLARAQVKRDLRDGTLSLAEALELECVRSMPLVALLSSQYRWGRARALRVVREVGCSENQRVGNLTVRQRAIVLRLAA